MGPRNFCRANHVDATVRKRLHGELGSIEETRVTMPTRLDTGTRWNSPQFLNGNEHWATLI